jgi:dTDP-3-amino-3,4,6-trideoxy-alpha-D-glucose transaminase
VRPGDEVITSPLTAAFTALAIVRAGARPVFADVDPGTLNVSAETVERALTPRTRAVVPVHLYGHPVDLDALYDLASRRSLLVVEDACQAHGARYQGRRVGSSGTATLSFYPTKNLGALGDGGAVLVQDPDLASHLRELRNGGQRARYEHLSLGTNSRLDEIQAAILRAKLPHLDAWVARRRAIATRYVRELDAAGLGLPHEAAYASSAWHLFVVRHRRREPLAAALRQRGVETLVHYPMPVHLQPAFAHLRQGEGSLPVAEAAAREVLSLPLYPELTDAQVATVIGAAREALACVQ